MYDLQLLISHHQAPARARPDPAGLIENRFSRALPKWFRTALGKERGATCLSHERVQNRSMSAFGGNRRVCCRHHQPNHPQLTHILNPYLSSCRALSLKSTSCPSTMVSIAALFVCSPVRRSSETQSESISNLTTTGRPSCFSRARRNRAELPPTLHLKSPHLGANQPCLTIPRHVNRLSPRMRAV